MGSSRNYLAFRLHRRDFAIDAAVVRAILPAAMLRPVRHPALSGTVVHAGREIPVLDLAPKLHLEPVPGLHPQVVIVVEHEIDGAAEWAAFPADRVSGVLAPFSRSPRPGWIRTAGRPRRILDYAALLRLDRSGIALACRLS
ncbi:MAG: chemotaxis protein CheW [Bryobacteraceae bacterium]|nr:chemotaxis protein CheW [Bryobacteraceae bacterium]